VVPDGLVLGVGFAQFGLGAGVAVGLTLPVGNGVGVAIPVETPLSAGPGVGAVDEPAHAVGTAEGSAVVGLGGPDRLVVVPLGLGCGVPDSPPPEAGTGAGIGGRADSARATESGAGT